MSLTRSEFETIMVRRLGPALARADMSTDVDGANPDLADPLSWSLLYLGFTPPSSITNPVDADLVQVQDASTLEFLAVAEWRLVKNIIGNLDDTDERLGPMGQWNSQFAKQMERYLENLEKTLEIEYGIGVLGLTTGLLRIVTTANDLVSS